MKKQGNEFKELVQLTKRYLQAQEETGGIQVIFKQSLPQQSPNLIEAIKGCTACPLHTTRHSVVVGEGSESAELMFIGEAPGHDEDMAGRPFVGQAGQLLTKIIESIGLTREEVYIANVLKCRPPENRNPEDKEIAACKHFILKQIELIHPKVTCALGTFAAQTLLGTDKKISALRGSFYDYQGIKIMPTFHPSYLLRNQPEKRKVWEDMKKIKNYLAVF